MKNTIYDYVDWRGDLNSFDFSFNEIDYFILGQLAYVNLDNIVTYTYQDTLTLQQAFELYNQRNQMFDDIQVKALQNESHYLFEKMAKSIRYQNIQIISYINDLDKELIKQFSAMTFLLEDESLCIGFRGTDEDLVGWHEDFLMLCEKVVPAQLSSVEYLNYIAQYPYQASFLTSLKNKKLGINIWQRAKKHIQLKKGRSLLLTGHSKGGNLAMYAGCFAYQQIKERITQIYNFDGPGFQEDVMTSQEYRSMLPKIHSFIPYYSFFGIVLGHEENYSVVHSHAHGMLQHNGFSWEVTPFGFVDDELSYESVQFAIKVIIFLEKLSYEDKRAFVDAMFHLFSALGLQTFNDLSCMSYKHILNGIKELTLLDSHVRKSFLEVLHMLWLESKKAKSE